MAEYQIGHLEVETPWGNAGGTVKRTEDVELMAKTGVGWIERGSDTLEPRIGNNLHGEVVYHHNPVTGATWNGLGMPGKGMDVIETEVPEQIEIAEAHGKKLIMNVAPVSDNPIEEAVELVDRSLTAGAHAVLLNAGCPNVVTADGGRHERLSDNPMALLTVLLGLTAVLEKHDQKLFVRVSPMQTHAKISSLMEAIKVSRVVSAVFTPNTYPGRPLDKDGQPILETPGGTGGLSGPATADRSLRETYLAASCLEGSDISLISSGGIMTGQELQRRMAAGAAGGAGTTLYWESSQEGWSEATDRLVRQYGDALNDS